VSASQPRWLIKDVEAQYIYMSINMDSTICGNIKFSQDAVCEMDGKKIIVSISKMDILRIVISFGRSAERPIAQGLSGLVLCAIGFFIGLIPLSNIIVGIINGEHINEAYYVIKPFAYASPLIFLGLWLIWSTFRKSYYLLVQTKEGERKLSIGKSLPSDVYVAASNYGYTVDNSGLGSPN
jgi:hypothetical protein